MANQSVGVAVPARHQFLPTRTAKRLYGGFRLGALKALAPILLLLPIAIPGRAASIFYSGTEVTFTVPTTGVYTISAIGAGGGSGTGGTGGMGAIVDGTFDLPAGEV